MDFLTPERFDVLIITNLVVGLVLIAYRFREDMTRPVEDPTRQREQQHDESSR